MRILLLCILIIFSLNVGADDTVRILNVATLTAVTGTTDFNFSLVAEAPSGDGTSEAAPEKIYIPIATTINAVNSTNYFYLNSQTTSHPIFGYTATAGASQTTFSGYTIDFPLVLTVGGTAKYLYAAVKAASSYVVADVYGGGTLISSVTNTQYDFLVSPQDICNRAAPAAAGSNCLNFDQSGASPSATQSAVDVYFFVSNTSIAIGTDIGTPSTTYPGGVYFQVNMSNQVFTSSALDITLSALRMGDSRVMGTFSSTATIVNNYKGTYAYTHSNDTDSCGVGREPANCTGSFASTPTVTSQSGDFTLSGLTNGLPVTVSVAFLDKYGFSTALSNSLSQKPTQIEQLLKKNAFFLLTAGFGEEHYVINYFRNFRDQVLIKYRMGKVFVSWYYQTAPQYALIIYKSSILRSAIRGAAYTLYFIFTNIRLLSAGLSLILVLLIIKRAKKWHHQRKI